MAWGRRYRSHLNTSNCEREQNGEGDYRQKAPLLMEANLPNRAAIARLAVEVDPADAKSGCRSRDLAIEIDSRSGLGAYRSGSLRFHPVSWTVTEAPLDVPFCDMNAMSPHGKMIRV